MTKGQKCGTFSTRSKSEYCGVEDRDTSHSQFEDRERLAERISQEHLFLYMNLSIHPQEQMFFSCVSNRYSLRLPRLARLVQLSWIEGLTVRPTHAFAENEPFLQKRGQAQECFKSPFPRLLGDHHDLHVRHRNRRHRPGDPHPHPRPGWHDPQLGNLAGSGRAHKTTTTWQRRPDRWPHVALTSYVGDQPLAPNVTPTGVKWGHLDNDTRLRRGSTCELFNRYSLSLPRLARLVQLSWIEGLTEIEEST